VHPAGAMDPAVARDGRAESDGALRRDDGGRERERTGSVGVGFGRAH
jgi:hypothetical protein